MALHRTYTNSIPSTVQGPLKQLFLSTLGVVIRANVDTAVKIGEESSFRELTSLFEMISW